MYAFERKWFSLRFIADAFIPRNEVIKLIFSKNVSLMPAYDCFDLYCLHIYKMGHFYRKCTLAVLKIENEILKLNYFRCRE